MSSGSPSLSWHSSPDGTADRSTRAAIGAADATDPAALVGRPGGVRLPSRPGRVHLGSPEPHRPPSGGSRRAGEYPPERIDRTPTDHRNHHHHRAGGRSEHRDPPDPSADD